ncbi:MAG: DUF4105 domain-containing protein [Deltaproteobacteria bacterium]|nr:DUF4105 domain-containing protein [Deltaproteobacteria bacterium]
MNFFLIIFLTVSSFLPKASSYEVSVLIVDPGDEIFSKFGHSALMVKRPDGYKKVYDFGNFIMDKKFIRDFIHGEAFYSLSVRSFDSFYDSYVGEERTIRRHKLNLTPEQAANVYSILEATYNSSERYYLYDHFRDNCATRIRDVISRATKGELREVMEKSKALSWRINLDRILGSSFLVKYGLKLILSSIMDSSRNSWDGAFLPLLLEEELLRSRIRLDPFGSSVPLVVNSEIIFKGKDHNGELKIPLWLYPILILFLFLIFAPFFYRDDPLFLKISVILVSSIVLILFGIMLFMHFHHGICSYNLNLIGFFPLLSIVLLWMVFKTPYDRIGKFFIAAMFFPLFQIFIRIFTIQKTFPFPESVLFFYILIFIQWKISLRKPSRDKSDVESAEKKEENKPLQQEISSS